MRFQIDKGIIWDKGRPAGDTLPKADMGGLIMTNGCGNEKGKRLFIWLFFGFWVLSLVWVYVFAPSSWLYYISTHSKKIVLFFFPTIKQNVDLFREEQVRAFLCVILLSIFSFFMYLLNKPLDGLIKQINDKGCVWEDEKQWSNYLSNKISGYSIFAGAMVTILVLILGFLMNRQIHNPGTLLIGHIASLLLLIGLILTLSCVEIISTASGRNWTKEHRDFLHGRAVRYYILSWYCLIWSILIIVSAAEPNITFVGTLVYSVLIPRYFFLLTYQSGNGKTLSQLLIDDPFYEDYSSIDLQRPTYRIFYIRRTGSRRRLFEVMLRRSSVSRVGNRFMADEGMFKLHQKECYSVGIC